MSLCAAAPLRTDLWHNAACQQGYWGLLLLDAPWFHSLGTAINRGKLYFLGGNYLSPCDKNCSSAGKVWPASKLNTIDNPPD